MFNLTFDPVPSSPNWGYFKSPDSWYISLLFLNRLLFRYAFSVVVLDKLIHKSNVMINIVVKTHRTVETKVN